MKIERLSTRFECIRKFMFSIAHPGRVSVEKYAQSVSEIGVVLDNGPVLKK